MHHIDLSWSGNAGNVDIKRDGNVVASNVASSPYTDNTGNKGGRTYQYEVCETGTSTCSNAVTVVF